MSQTFGEKRLGCWEFFLFTKWFFSISACELCEQHFSRSQITKLPVARECSCPPPPPPPPPRPPPPPPPRLAGPPPHPHSVPPGTVDIQKLFFFFTFCSGCHDKLIYVCAAGWMGCLTGSATRTGCLPRTTFSTAFLSLSLIAHLSHINFLLVWIRLGWQMWKVCEMRVAWEI